MKKLLYLLCFLPFCLQAQTTETTLSDTTGHKLMMTFTDQDSLQDSVPHRTSYMSFFGKRNTKWSLVIPIPSYTTLLNGGSEFSVGDIVEDIIYNESDTCTYKGHFYVGVLREDTLNGRLYRYYSDSVEILWCDMSLKLGDTFRLPNVVKLTKIESQEYAEQDALLIADSVYYLDGRKIIRFKSNVSSYSHYYDGEIPFYFIEGVGPIYGPLGHCTVKDFLMLMLCVYKDDTLDFMTNSFWGCHCWDGPGWFVDAVKEPKRTTLTLQPNPAQDYIMLRNEDASDLGGEVIITDAIGRVLRHCTMENAEMRINIGSYGSGTYFVRYRSQNGVQVLKFVKVQ